MSTLYAEELRVRDKGRALLVKFHAGDSYEIPAELLRVESPSAEVQGHGPGQEVLVVGKRAVTITGVEAVGSYAVKLIFSDGHDTGLFTWAYLAHLGRNRQSLMADYEQRVAKAGMSRGNA